MKIIFNLIIISLLTISCSQKTAPISYKGHLHYTEKGPKPVVLSKKLVKKTAKKINPAKLQNNQIIIKDGDNLYNLAKAYKVSTRQLIDHNKLAPPYVLHPGKTLKIPTERKTHVVIRGQNLTKIARKYNVSLSELAQLNNLKTNTRIKIGDVLVVPYSAKTSHKRFLAKKIFNSKVKLARPVKGKVIQKFGAKSDGTYSDGINIAAPAGTNIAAAADGKVVYVGSELRGYGNLIIIKHSGNILTAYAHSNEVFVAKDQKVKQGETISTVGSSGNVKTAQLHFGVRKGRKAVNPSKYFN